MLPAPSEAGTCQLGSRRRSLSLAVGYHQRSQNTLPLRVDIELHPALCSWDADKGTLLCLLVVSYKMPPHVHDRSLMHAVPVPRAVSWATVYRDIAIRAQVQIVGRPQTVIRLDSDALQLVS
jgi:hypothetical protein